MTTTFPHFVLRGSHREVGRQHGEALRSLIVPMGVQITAGRYREDLCLDAAAAIEARAPMATPIDPVSR